MKALSTLVLVIFLLSSQADVFADNKVFVVLFMHNEDGTFGDLDDPSVRGSYLRHREKLIEMCQYLHDNQVSFAWQSDWKFLELLLMYETEDLMAETNGKNIVRWMKEDMGIAVDAHSHEHFGYNYADVACLLDSIGVEPTRIIGGHIWDPYISTYADWERFREPLQGQKFPHFNWSADVLMGSGTPNHTFDPAPSGIWRPRDKYHFWEDDPDGDVLCVGQYTGDLEGVQALIDLKKSGEIAEDEILTCCIHTPQGFSPDFMDDFRSELIEPLIKMREDGDIEMVDFSELMVVWELNYSSKTHLYNPLTDYVPDQFDIWIPGESAGAKGLFTRVSVPEEARYSGDQAPVVVHVAGGWDGLGVTQKSHGVHRQGIIELDFNFPGSGLAGSTSGGVFDHRGEDCIQAVRDIARFALGLTPDNHGYYLRDMLGDIEPDITNVGLCGWSNGGNATITAAGAYGDELPGLAWIVNWESPVGDGMPNVDAGGHNQANLAYNPDTGEFDDLMLDYDGLIHQGAHYGAFYFDVNENGVYDQTIDFVPSYQSYKNKRYYSEWIAEAAKAFGYPFPSHIASAEATASFWTFRNGEYWIEEALSFNPDLMFMVEAGDRDHVQGAPDHPHILIQYMGFLNAGARFVRLNPDRFYIEQLIGAELPDCMDNNGFEIYDHGTIRNALQPRSIPILTSEISVSAAICELCDRTRDDNVNPQIDVSSGVGRIENPVVSNMLTIYPNPFDYELTVRFLLEKRDQVRIDILNLNGQVLQTIVEADLSAGDHEYRLAVPTGEISGLAPGVYCLRVTKGNENFIKRIVKL